MKFDVNDIVGKTFGKLSVINFDHKEQIFTKNNIKNGYKYFYLCLCECGNKIIVSRHHLLFKHTKSCGCITKTHNLSNSRLYKIYNGMKHRCYNPKNYKYKNYGGRGITICQEWQEDFINFYTWAINNNYADNLSIDRINANGNYEPDNCRWVNMKTQQNNRTNNHLLTFGNETHSINEWAEILNIKRETIKSRLFLGWSISKALTTPVRPRNQQSSDIQ